MLEYSPVILLRSPTNHVCKVAFYEYIEVVGNQFLMSFQKYPMVADLLFHRFSMQTNPTHLSISHVARIVMMSVQNLRKTYINK